MDYSKWILIYGHIIVLYDMIENNTDIFNIFYIYLLSIFLSLFVCIYNISKLGPAYNYLKISENIVQDIPGYTLIFCIFLSKISAHIS